MATAPALQLPDVEAMSAEDVLRWAHDHFGDRMCLTCSWQRQSSVLVHMVGELGLNMPIVELDTHVFFPETYETRERLVERYGLTLRSRYRRRSHAPGAAVGDASPTAAATSARSSRSSAPSRGTTRG